METIGDAYMVVAGAPEVCTDHAQRVANQGIDMIQKAEEVRSPATGKPLQVSDLVQSFHNCWGLLFSTAQHCTQTKHTLVTPPDPCAH